MIMATNIVNLIHKMILLLIIKIGDFGQVQCYVIVTAGIIIYYYCNDGFNFGSTPSSDLTSKNDNNSLIDLIDDTINTPTLNETNNEIFERDSNSTRYNDYFNSPSVSNIDS